MRSICFFLSVLKSFRSTVIPAWEQKGFLHISSVWIITRQTSHGNLLPFSTGWRKVNAFHVCFSSVTQSSSSEGLVSDAVIITAALCLPTTMHLAFISTTFLHPSSLSHQFTSFHTWQTFTRWSSSASKWHFSLNIYSQSISYITPFIKSYYNSICL